MLQRQFHDPTCGKFASSSYLSEHDHNELENPGRDEPNTTFYDVKSANKCDLLIFTPNESSDQVENKCGLPVYGGHNEGLGRVVKSVKWGAMDEK